MRLSHNSLLIRSDQNATVYQSRLVIIFRTCHSRQNRKQTHIREGPGEHLPEEDGRILHLPLAQNLQRKNLDGDSIKQTKILRL